MAPRQLAGTKNVMPSLSTPSTRPLHPNISAIDQILAEAENAAVRAFLDYIRSIHPSDRLPARLDFDPLDIPQLLPGVVLAKVERHADGENPRLRFRVVVAGEDVLNVSPVPMMGRYVDEIAAAVSGNAQILTDIRQQVVQTGRTCYWNGLPRIKFRLDFAGLEYCHCPLADDGRNVDYVVSFFHYKGANLF